MPFFFATEEPFARNSVAAHLFYDRFDRCLPCPSAAGEILREHLIDDSNFEAQTCACAHGLPLAVGG
ncbi:MAG TPA: hypothetical protein VD761_00675 [Solirubrobacterales bacterium]|nr:hypothetical protein [Solirubrobacterales bacterium]